MKHTNRRPDNLTPTGILIRSALEADGEDGDEGNAHFAFPPLFNSDQFSLVQYNRFVDR